MGCRPYTQAGVSWGWLLEQFGWELEQGWDSGSSWRMGDSYLVAARPPAVASDDHNRRLPGLNHLAFQGGTPGEVDRLLPDAPKYGWTALYADRYPHAGGTDHYAAYFENKAGFKAEVVAASPAR